MGELASVPAGPMKAILVLLGIVALFAVANAIPVRSVHEWQGSTNGTIGDTYCATIYAKAGCDSPIHNKTCDAVGKECTQDAKCMWCSIPQWHCASLQQP